MHCGNIMYQSIGNMKLCLGNQITAELIIKSYFMVLYQRPSCSEKSENNIFATVSLLYK